MNKGGSRPDLPAEGAAGCRLAGELLHDSQYEQVAAILHIAQTQSAQAGDIVLTHLLDAARLLCVALIACHAEVERHKQAYQETECREQKLRQELSAVLDLLSKSEMPRVLPAQKQTPRIPTPPAKRPPPGYDSAGQGNRPGLWQRIRTLLLGPMSWSPGRESPEAIVEEPDRLLDQPDASLAPSLLEPGIAPTSIEAERASQPTPQGTEEPPTLSRPEPEPLAPIPDAIERGLPERAEAQAAPQPKPEPSFTGEPEALETSQSEPEREEAAAAPIEQKGREKPVSPSLVVYCLGPFRVYQNGLLVEKWRGLKCKHIFKYLVTHREHPTHRDILMDLFWRDAPPEAARRNLYQAIYHLRKTLQSGNPDFDPIASGSQDYSFNPDLEIWVDSEAFVAHYQAGQRLERNGRMHEAVQEYAKADSLYAGEYMAEDRYEDWPLEHRENLKHAYLAMLAELSQYHFAHGQISACIAFCQKILAEDKCREDAHRRLMRCYIQQGQRHLALRQYQLCVEALRQELDVLPMPATIKLYQQIQQDDLYSQTDKN